MKVFSMFAFWSSFRALATLLNCFAPLSSFKELESSRFVGKVRVSPAKFVILVTRPADGCGKDFRLSNKLQLSAARLIKVEKSESLSRSQISDKKCFVDNLPIRLNFWALARAWTFFSFGGKTGNRWKFLKIKLAKCFLRLQLELQIKFQCWWIYWRQQTAQREALRVEINFPFFSAINFNDFLHLQARRTLEGAAP